MLTPVGILYHDVGQSLPFVLYLLMFLSPVLYPVPQSGGFVCLGIEPGQSDIGYRAGLAPISAGGTFGGISITTALAIFTLLIGWLLYRLALPILIERMSA